MADRTYFDGEKERTISKAQLREIKSNVVTHEGEHLQGQAARNYMDKYSEKYLGKDLSGKYNNDEV